MKTAPPTRPIQILTLTLVGVGLLVLFAAGVLGRFSVPAGAPAASPTAGPDAITPEAPITVTPAQPPTPTLPSSSPTPAPARPFAVPLTPQPEGFTWAWPQRVSLTGFAVGADGSFWVGDGATHITHYSPSGVRLGTLDLAGRINRIYDFKIHDSDLWLLGVGFQGNAAGLLRLDLDGHTGAQYPLPDLPGGSDLLDMCLVKPDCALILGRQGEVVLAGLEWRAILELVDAQGTLTLQELSALPGWAHLYTTHYTPVWNDLPQTGLVSIDGITVTLTLSHRLNNLGVFAVNPDASFYVLAGEEMAAPQGVFQTLYHFAADGTLLEHARLPGTDAYVFIAYRLALGPDGTLYYLDLSAGGLATIRRVPFVPVTEPLPTLVPDTPTPVPPSPTPTPPWTLDRLAAAAGAIAEVAVLPGYPPGDRGWVGLQVVRWWKEPPDMKGNPIVGPSVVRVEPPADLPANSWPPGSRFVLFLEYPVGSCPPDLGFYEITGGLLGIFPLQDTQMGTAALPGYAGLSLTQFAALLRLSLPPPIATPSATDALQALAQLARRSDAIADVTLATADGAGGNIGYTFNVQTWYKRPPDATDETLRATVPTCNGGYFGIGKAHNIIFLSSGAAGRQIRMVEAVFAVNGDVIEQGEIGYYWGQPVAAFEHDLRAALQSASP